VSGTLSYVLVRSPSFWKVAEDVEEGEGGMEVAAEVDGKFWVSV
jgi:hypothetical protein